MERSCLVLLVLFFLVLGFFDFSLGNTEVSGKLKSGSDSNSNSTGSSDEKIRGSGSVSNGTDTKKAEKGGVRLNRTKEVKENVTNTSDTETNKTQKGKGNLNEQVVVARDDEKTRKSGDESESKKATEEKGRDKEVKAVQDDQETKKSEDEPESKKVSEGKGSDKGVKTVQDDQATRKSEDESESKKVREGKGREKAAKIVQDNQESQNKSNEKGTDGDSTPRIPLRKEGSRGEVCDPSNRCTDEEDQFVACLRVPGNESPDLSLLIQNKGEGPVVVKISAPSFVQLEKNRVQLQRNEDKKVKVSIRHGGRSNFIVLRGKNGHCSLDFRDLVMHSLGKEHVEGLDGSSQQHGFIRPLSLPSVSLVFAAMTILILVSICIHRRQSQGQKYQRVEVELPVSTAEAVNDDDWNDNWGDDSWDDEETPKTPSMPITPSVSSKGLASRRLSKEAWKD